MDGSCPYGIRCTFVHDSDVQQPEKTWHHVRRNSLDTSSTSSSSSSSDNGDIPHQVKQLYYNDHPNNDFRCYNIPPNNKTMWM